VEIQGQRVGFARGRDSLFVDARPPHLSGRKRDVSTRVIGGRYLGDGTFEVDVEWEVKRSLEPGLRPFVHIGHQRTGDQGEQIAHHGSMNLPEDALTKTGLYAVTIQAEIPPTSFGGEYELRYGLYNPGKGGYRIRAEGNLEGDRLRGGKLLVTIENGKIKSGDYVEEHFLDNALGLNTHQRKIDFGPVVTNGAFRMMMGDSEWTLIPLPNSKPFQAECRLAQLGVPANASAILTPVTIEGVRKGGIPLKSAAGILSLSLDAEYFAYTIRFSGPGKGK